jgi:hypothetical protein
MALSREEAQGWMVEMLMEKVRNDRYPSTTQMQIIEESIPRELIPDYLEILIEKAGEDTIPSVPLLQRISRVAASLPPAQRRR